MNITWPDLNLPPVNLWNFLDWRYSYMSDGMTDWMREHQEKAPHADHYRKLNPEPITVIENWKLNFNLGNAIKYISRCNYKGNKQADLAKAIWYLQREMSRTTEDIPVKVTEIYDNGSRTYQK